MLSLVHSILVMLALLSLHSIELIPASGPLHLLFPLSGAISPQIIPVLALYHHSASVITPQASSNHLSFSIPTLSTIENLSSIVCHLFPLDKCSMRAGTLTILFSAVLPASITLPECLSPTKW